MSNAEKMVMVPRELAEAAWQALDDDGRFEVSCPLREALDKPAQQGQGEPVALPERRPDLSVLLGKSHDPFMKGQDIGWNACLDYIAELGPLYKHPAPGRGEPVAWMDPRSPQMHATISNEVKQHNVKFGGAPSSAVNGYTIPLYTHADPSEVERWKNHAINTDIANAQACQKLAELRAQLAERNAVLVKANYVIDHARTLDKQAFSRGTQNVDHDLFRGLGNLLAQYDEALSASAEPSAPVEIDERAEFEDWGKTLFYIACFERDEDGHYVGRGLNGAWLGWQARAALARKSVEPLPPVDGDLLPPIGSKVLIHLGREDKWAEHTVVGYYAWGNHGLDQKVYRVFVRVRDAEGYLNARLLSDVRPFTLERKP